MEHSVSEGGEDKENILEHSEGFSAPFKLPLLSPPIYQQPREVSWASMGRSPRKELERTETPAGNQMLAQTVSNPSNRIEPEVIPYLVQAIHGSSSHKGSDCDL